MKRWRNENSNQNRAERRSGFGPMNPGVSYHCATLSPKQPGLEDPAIVNLDDKIYPFF